MFGYNDIKKKKKIDYIMIHIPALMSKNANNF